MTVLLTAVLTAVFLASSGVKLLGLQRSLRNRDRFGLSPTVWRAIGVLELAGVAGILLGLAVPALGMVAGIGLALLMIGAAATRLRVRDPIAAVAGDVAVLALVVLYLVVRS